MVLHIFTKRLLINKIRSRYRLFHTSVSQFKIVQFLLSDIGEGIREVTVSEWFVNVGDEVKQFDNICCVESDKASVNITSRYDGTIKKIYHDVGAKALVGKPLIDIDTNEDASDSSSEGSSSDESTVVKEEVKPISITPIFESEPLTLSEIIKQKALATPAVRRIAMEHGISLSTVKGTGKSGRILKEDILNHLGSDGATEYSPESKPTVTDIIPITGIKKVMFNTMTQSNLIPSFNFYEEINVTNLIQLKKEVQSRAEERQIKLTYMPFFIKAMSKALLEYPEINASLDSKHENIIVNKNHNIGVAVDSKGGLVVPNVKNVESLSVLGVAKEMNRILEKGKQGIFNPSDLKGGTITISNVGMIGGTYTRPLILPPELVIVALGKISKKPIFSKDNDLTSADILYSSWTADHRVIDGATLARFVTMWKYYLENPSALILDL